MAYVEVNGVRQDAPRNVARKLLRVTVAPWQMTQVIPGGHLLTPGTHEVVVYEDEVDLVKALVHTDTTGLEFARNTFAAKLEEHNKELREAGVDPASRPIPDSVEKTYRDQNAGRRDVLPLLSVEVLNTLPAPTVERASADGSAIASAVAAAITNALPMIVTAVSEQMAKQNRKS